MKISTLAVAILIAAAAPAVLASTAAEREYQRGYNDCSHGRYDQDRHGESYKKGCRAAEDGQKQQSPSAKHESATTKPASKVKISDLKGMDSIKAFDVMTARGFKSVDSLTAGETIYGTYYNAKTHQCVQLTSAHDRVKEIDDVPSHPQCR
jgi:hypothetical protein